MNSTLTLLMTSLLLGTSFLQKITPDQLKLAKNTESRTYVGNHPLLVRPEEQETRDRCWETASHKQDENRRLINGYPFGRPLGGGIVPGAIYPGILPGRGTLSGIPDIPQDNCQVKIGLHYSSCFSKYDDFDDKFDELQHHVPSLARGSEGFSSPCSTLQLLAKVKSTPLFDRCHGNQYILRIPFHMYNIKGELRYIVQDAPHLEQCYLEAACNVPTQLCSSVGYPTDRRPSSCEARQCHHTLLSWDPANPNIGTFFDTFEYACCCNCHTIPVRGRAQIIG